MSLTGKLVDREVNTNQLTGTRVRNASYRQTTKVNKSSNKMVQLEWLDHGIFS